MTTTNLIVLALLLVMMVVWTIVIRRISRQGERRVEELAELQRKERELELQVLDQEDWTNAPKA
ncbi:MAG TPA: hypothetical protein PKJ99_13985 [Thermoanaerobaculales bacterium]|nr:hypothetical protein [Thermoanaerobaculales bacterium]